MGINPVSDMSRIISMNVWATIVTLFLSGFILPRLLSPVVTPLATSDPNHSDDQTNNFLCQRGQITELSLVSFYQFIFTAACLSVNHACSLNQRKIFFFTTRKQVSQLKMHLWVPAVPIQTFYFSLLSEINEAWLGFLSTRLFFPNEITALHFK